MGNADELGLRARVHAALADTTRLAIVDALTVSDRSATELTQLTGVTPSLLTHHLDQLEQAGLVTRSRSAGDARRRYIRLDDGPLSTLSVRRTLPELPVLFVCTRNAARSQLAAALWIAHTGTPARSAGTHPASRIHPGAIAAAQRAGLCLGGATPQAFADGDTTDHHVITVCDMAHEELPAAVTTAPTSWHWSTPAPGVDATDERFDMVVGSLTKRLVTLGFTSPRKDTP